MDPLVELWALRRRRKPGHAVVLLRSTSNVIFSTIYLIIGSSERDNWLILAVLVGPGTAWHDILSNPKGPVVCPVSDMESLYATRDVACKNDRGILEAM